MMKKSSGFGLILTALLLLMPAVPAGSGGEDDYAWQETRELVAFVEAAAQVVRQEGEKAFPAFRMEGGRWFQGVRYIFVWDLKGNRYVYPPDPGHEQANLIDLVDAGGKPIGKMIVEAASRKEGHGWVHYQWNRPHETTPAWKSTYIVRAVAPSGKEYLVGSGIYDGRMEKAYIIDEVEAASALLVREGKAAFAVLRDPKSRFFFHDTYVFVTSADGTELVNPAFPALEGRSLWDMQDIRGNYLVREYVATALKRGSGWVTYFWPKPEAPQVPVTKTTYVKKVTVDEEVMIVGAGMYE